MEKDAGLSGDAETVTDDEFAAPMLAKIRQAVRGNGIRPNAVSTKECTQQTSSFTGKTTLELRFHTTEKTQPGKFAAKRIFHDVQQIRNTIDADNAALTGDEQASAQIIQLVLERSDKGFGIKNQTIALPFLMRDYVTHETCQPCRGTGKIPCLRCKGRGHEVCPTCKGVGLETCQRCRGSAKIPDSQGGQRPCPECHGRAKMPCRQCKQKQSIPCRICRTSGSSPCKNCENSGFLSKIIHVDTEALASFECETKTLPEDLLKLIDETGIHLADHARLLTAKRTPAKQDKETEETLSISYEAQISYGTSLYSVKGLPVPVTLIGQDRTPLKVPFFLEKILAPGLKSLNAVANEQHPGQIQANLKKAMRYATIRHAVTVAASNHDKNKAVRAVLQRTPFGISQTTVQAMISNAVKALDSLTLRDRRNGMIIGGAIAMAVLAIYFLTPLRNALITSLPGSSLHILIDGLTVIVALAAGYIVERQNRVNARRNALRKLQKNSGGKKSGQ